MWLEEHEQGGEWWEMRNGHLIMQRLEENPETLAFTHVEIGNPWRVLIGRVTCRIFFFL